MQSLTLEGSCPIHLLKGESFSVLIINLSLRRASLFFFSVSLEANHGPNPSVHTHRL